MKYEAKPITVEAHKLVSRGAADADGNVHCALENGDNVTATAAMTARFLPSPGDYWVIQEDGYVYLNPAAVFERKYYRTEY
jgi:hypothetical protein